MLQRLLLIAAFVFSGHAIAEIHESVEITDEVSIDILSEFAGEEAEVERRRPRPRPPRTRPRPRPRPPHGRTYVDWGQGRDGTGYCYEFFRNGQVANGGRPISNHACERYNPSYYDYGRGRDGYYYCYQFTPYGVVMNQGRAVPMNYCRY